MIQQQPSRREALKAALRGEVVESGQIDLGGGQLVTMRIVSEGDKARIKREVASEVANVQPDVRDDVFASQEMRRILAVALNHEGLQREDLDGASTSMLLRLWHEYSALEATVTPKTDAEYLLLYEEVQALAGEPREAVVSSLKKRGYARLLDYAVSSVLRPSLSPTRSSCTG